MSSMATAVRNTLIYWRRLPGQLCRLIFSSSSGASRMSAPGHSSASSRYVLIYMLDSNICIDVINSRPAIVLERFRLERLGDIVISSVTAAELALGVVKSGSARNRLALEMFLSTIAAHALTSNTILVTNNTREFERVPGLRLENWAI